MACTHPFHGFPTGYKTASGKDEIFISFTADRFIPGWQVEKRFGHPSRDLEDYIEIPCGKCFECRKDKANKWAFRCLFEAEQHKENFFVTLTFDDAHYVNDLKSVVREVQLFFKRLRKVTEFRYFGCIERGELGGRLHAHILLFGPSLDRLIPWSRSGFMLYRSELIEACWPNGFSSVGIAQVSAVANYIAKYTMKNDGQDCKLLMSLRPAIGVLPMLAEVMKDNPNPYGWKLLTLGDGRGNVWNGSLPRCLRDRLGIKPDDEIARACILKIQNQMRACGYSSAEAEDFDKVVRFRFNKEKSDKLRECFFNKLRN